MAVGSVELRSINEVYVKVNTTPDILYELRDHFTFKVPGYQFTPQYKSRMWDGNIRLLDSRTNTIYRGLSEHIEKFCASRDYDFTYDSLDTAFSIEEAKDFIDTLNIPNIEVRDYQINAFVHAIRKKRALLLSPTASGKSLIIYLLLRKINANRILIIVPTTSLVSQLASDFADYGFDSDNLVHSIFAGRDKQSDKKVFISTWQSLYKLPKSYFEQFDAVIGDEAHLFKSKEISGLMGNLTKAEYRIGTTGTLDGSKTHKLVLEGLFGPVHKVTTTKELMDNKVVADFEIKCLLLKHPKEICYAAREFTYQDEIEYLVLSEARNKLISNLALSLNGNTLILYQYVDKHGKILYDLVTKKIDSTRKCFFIYGKTDVEIREEVRGIVEKESNAIIIASYGTFSTGVNIKNLHSIIFASPSKSRIRNLQSIGRGLRKSDTKDSAVLFDIADDLRWKKKENYTLKHFSERIKIYSEEKFKFKIYKIDLKG